MTGVAHVGSKKRVPPLGTVFAGTTSTHRATGRAVWIKTNSLLRRPCSGLELRQNEKRLPIRLQKDQSQEGEKIYIGSKKKKKEAPLLPSWSRLPSVKQIYRGKDVVKKSIAAVCPGPKEEEKKEDAWVRRPLLLFSPKKNCTNRRLIQFFNTTFTLGKNRQRAEN